MQQPADIPKRATSVQDSSATPAEPLLDPIPRVSTILVSANRRFALVDGRVIGVGDRIGPRIVMAIDAKTVILKEPSGLQIRVGLGGRLLGVDRPRGGS